MYFMISRDFTSFPQCIEFQWFGGFGFFEGFCDFCQNCDFGVVFSLSIVLPIFWIRIWFMDFMILGDSTAFPHCIGFKSFCGLGFLERFIDFWEKSQLWFGFSLSIILSIFGQGWTVYGFPDHMGIYSSSTVHWFLKCWLFRYFLKGLVNFWENHGFGVFFHFRLFLPFFGQQ